MAVSISVTMSVNFKVFLQEKKQKNLLSFFPYKRMMFLC